MEESKEIQYCATGTNDIERQIKLIIQKENLKSAKYTITKVARTLGEVGSHYLSKTFNVHLAGDREGKLEEYNLFVKLQLAINPDTETISIDKAYERERVIYTAVFRIFDILQNDANIAPEDRFRFAKFYDTNNHNCIIMENLFKKGYLTWDAKKPITLEYALLGVEYLAKWHALSFIMEANMPEHFSQLKQKLSSVMDFHSRKTLDFVKNQCEAAMEVVDSEEKKNKLSKIFQKVEALPRYYSSQSNLKKCLCHNDMHVYNAMYKLNNEGLVSEVIALDFQISYYGFPLTDVFFFLFGATDQQLRAEHMGHFIEHYYSSLAGFLKKFNFNIDTVYPRQQFDSDYKELIVDHGLVLTLMSLGFILAPEDDAPDMGKSSLGEIRPKFTEVYKARVNGLVQDVIDWGFL